MRQPYIASHFIVYGIQNHRHSARCALQHYLVIKITVQDKIIRHTREASLPSLIRMEDMMLAGHSTTPRPAPGDTASCSRVAHRHVSRSGSNRASKPSPKVSFFVVFFFRVPEHAFNAVQYPG
jgi:hypothetical protein